MATRLKDRDVVVIGMGAVVTKSIQTPGGVWVGNPARRLARSSENFGVPV